MSSNSDQDIHKESACGEGKKDLSLDAFRTELDVFSGPLELLMYLIQRDEVDILEIPISHITDQYLKALHALQLFDVNVAAEFVVMAATLMDVKSRSLLPSTSINDDETDVDPRDELVHQLLEYKRFKKISLRLRNMAEERARQFCRIPYEPPGEPDPVSADNLLDDITVWGLLSAYGAIVREIEMSQPHRIVYDEVPIKEYMERIMEHVSNNDGKTSFLSFFGEEPPRLRIIGLFLALLELVRQHEITLEQADDNRTEIIIQPIAGEDSMDYK